MAKNNSRNVSGNVSGNFTEDRRSFLKWSGLGALGAFFGARLLSQSTVAHAQGAAKLELLKETDPQAKALGYYADASKVDKKKYPKRADAEGAKQFCYNCQFYQFKGDPKTSASAPCTLFPGKGVTAKGWCQSWTLNPNVKG